MENRYTLTYSQAQQLSLTVEWKTRTCSQGEECWCRIIEPIEKITDVDGSEICIASSGDVSEIYAEHIVKLHNDSLKIKK